mmetsp:Transcript_19437/g.57610  ORF Transcript_19437/g.57610 Transcript_19437/m.57610 type:complete len:230 (-) Transcript_19437:1600-2289(-)
MPARHRTSREAAVPQPDTRSARSAGGQASTKVQKGGGGGVLHLRSRAGSPRHSQPALVIARGGARLVGQERLLVVGARVLTRGAHERHGAEDDGGAPEGDEEGRGVGCCLGACRHVGHDSARTRLEGRGGERRRMLGANLVECVQRRLRLVRGAARGGQVVALLDVHLVDLPQPRVGPVTLEADALEVLLVALHGRRPSPRTDAPVAARRDHAAEVVAVVLGGRGQEGV